jgi:hypothetical protein
MANESLFHRNHVSDRNEDVDFKETLKPNQKNKRNLYRVIILTSLCWILIYGLILFYMFDNYQANKSSNKENDIHDLHYFNRIFLENLRSNKTKIFGHRDDDNEKLLFWKLTELANRLNLEHRSMVTSSRQVKIILNREQFLHQQLEELKKERKQQIKIKLELMRKHLNERFKDNIFNLRKDVHSQKSKEHVTEETKKSSKEHLKETKKISKEEKPLEKFFIEDHSNEPTNPSSWPGENGKSVVIPDNLKAEAEKRFKENNFNIVASDLIALNRSVGDRRPKG